MNIFSLDEYRKMAEEALKETGAFVRLSRGEGLFVTDALRRGCDLEFLSDHLSSFQLFVKDGLVFLTPDYGFDTETNGILTDILKADQEKREKIIRTHLSKSMRLKDQRKIALFQLLYERMV